MGRERKGGRNGRKKWKEREEEVGEKEETGRRIKGNGASWKRWGKSQERDEKQEEEEEKEERGGQGGERRKEGQRGMGQERAGRGEHPYLTCAALSIIKCLS